ncbi:MAG TPA: ATP-dependent zinc metalloprotease FtsH [Opitutaceae bacterium]|nr:ATP-dependent zinc metalloprotease FtsH [Opitutaceae bacterium]
MPEPDNKSPRRPLKKLPPENFFSKAWLVWLAIIAAVIALLVLGHGADMGPDSIKIQRVVELAEQGKIVKGEIRRDGAGGREWVTITGEATEPPSLASKSNKFTSTGWLTDANLERLQKSQKFDEPAAQTLVSTILQQVVPFVIIIGLLYFLFVRQLRQAGRGALNFGKSRAKLLTRDRDRVMFADVAGCDEAKEEVSEVVEFLKDPKKFQKMGGRIPKGILMVGPPGTGKTLLAKAVAGEADVPFFSISGSDFVEMFVGVGASRVRDMFEQGRKNAPCLIFIDEIDAVGRQRGAGVGGGNDEREQTLNSLLVEMDGFDTTEGVIIIAATNRPDVLDSALLRPGRFDRQIYVDLPDLVGREQILRVHARKISLADSVDLSIIARGTPGLSGADLANLLNESALLAARRGKKKVEMIDVEDAREKVIFGRERRKVMDDEDKKIVAYHEAGHAVVMAVLDDGILPVHKVTIIPRGQSLGSTMYLPKKDTYNFQRGRMLNRMAAAMGGRIAEELALPDVTSGASGDIKQITSLARSMVCEWGLSPLGMIAYTDNQDTVFLGREITRSHTLSEEMARKIDNEIKRIVDEQYERAKGILVQHRVALDKIAAALLEYETIEGKHVKEILEFGEIRTPVVVALPPQKPDDKAGGKKAPERSAAPEPLGGGTPVPNPTPA